MLSVLIPTYNYNTFPLAEAICEQALALKIPFEILVLDDASTDINSIQKNAKINELEFGQYTVNPENIGRAANRNLLAQKAQYPWLLFLDCDTLPVHNQFVSEYADYCQKDIIDACFGGLAYLEEPPEKEEVLRWMYGKDREALSLERRKKNPYQSSLVSNFLIRKELVERFPFRSEIKKYGFEDFVFLSELKKNKVNIEQIDNRVYHLNYEKSTEFLAKHILALDHLYALINQGMIDPNETTIGQWSERIKKYKLNSIVSAFHWFCGGAIKKNLLSAKPSLLLFDLYKLGYFCSIKN